MQIMAELVEHTCPVCFIYYAIPARMEREKRKDGGSFFCPNGHSLSYKESEFDKLKRERDMLQQNQAYLDDRLREEMKGRKAAEKETRSLKKRASAGVCPCCHRQFQNMASHMKTKHPEFKAEVLKVVK